jgi:hypothetical protein
MTQEGSLVHIELGEIQNSCFVVMPFDPLFQVHYEQVIRPAVEKLGIKCVRGDEIYSKPHIMGDIWKSIREARLVIAELTGRNPNVFYEVGLAHALGKPIILLTRNEDDVPFDLKALRYRFYDINDPFWGENLVNAIRTMVQNVLDEPGLSTYLDGIHHEIRLPQQLDPVLIESPPVAPAIEISGLWHGTWKRFDATIDHKGTVFFTQREKDLLGTLTVTFVREHEETIVQEVLVGSISGANVMLNGVSYTYIKQGGSRSYLLDNFDLQLSNDRKTMKGEFFSRRGKGGAMFERVG